MLVRDLVKKVHHYYEGDTDYPTEGGSDGMYDVIVSGANDLIRDEWATDPDNKWRSTWVERTLGTVTESRRYRVGDDLFDLSDWVYVDTLANGTAEFAVIDASQREYAGNGVLLTGDPKVITFVGPMGEHLIGGTIRAGVHVIPRELKRPTDRIPVDRPLWLVYRLAAELCRNDRAKDDQFANLIGLANEQWKKMVRANRKAGPGRPRRVRHSGNRMRRRY